MDIESARNRSILRFKASWVRWGRAKRGEGAFLAFLGEPSAARLSFFSRWPSGGWSSKKNKSRASICLVQANGNEAMRKAYQPRSNRLKTAHFCFQADCLYFFGTTNNESGMSFANSNLLMLCS
jgi:hypothetical protein